MNLNPNVQARSLLVGLAGVQHVSSAKLPYLNLKTTALANIALAYLNAQWGLTAEGD